MWGIIGELVTVISWAAWAAWAGALVAWDLLRRRLPNALTLSGAAVAAAAAVIAEPWWLLGGLAWAGLYAALALAGGSVGGGDVKLAFPLGVLSAASGGIVGVWLAVVAAGVVTAGVGLMARRGEGLPHGPAMLVGAAAAVVWASG